MPHGPAYEKLVAQLVSGLLRGAAMNGHALSSGAKNRVAGLSGYKHQIDLSVAGPGTLYLFELKCLQRSIGVEEVLVLAGRQSDIAAANPSLKVLASMVSLMRPSRNVPALAMQFGFQLEIVENLASYGISFAGNHFVGHVERLEAIDTMDAVLTRGNGA